MDVGTVAAAILVVLVVQHSWEAICDSVRSWLKAKSKPWTFGWLAKGLVGPMLRLPGRIARGVVRDIGGGSKELRSWWAGARERWDSAGGGPEDEIEDLPPPAPEDPEPPLPEPPPAPPAPAPAGPTGPVPVVSERAGYSETMRILQWILTVSETAESLGWSTAAAVARSELDARTIASISALSEAASRVWDSAKFAVDTLEERHGQIVRAVEDAGVPMAAPGYYQGGSGVGGHS